VLTGDTGGKVMQPTTTLALIEQGMTVYSAIFKRLHRDLGRELQLHAEINSESLSAEDYNAFFDDPEQQYDPKADYGLDDMAITPVSDPSVSTNMQKLAKSQVAREIGGGKPWINQMELDRRAFEAAEIPDYEGLFVPPPEPDPFAEAMKNLSIEELGAKIGKDNAAAIKSIADAEAAEAGQQLTIYDAFVRWLKTGHDMEMQANGQIPGGPGGLPGMAGEPGDEMGAPALSGPGIGDGTDGGGIPPELVGAEPGGMGGAPAESGASAGAM
jgi:chaperonin GroES